MNDIKKEQEIDLRPYLAATPIIQAKDPAIRAFAKDAVAGATDPVAQACRLYYAVRDGVRYDPYSIVLTVEGLSAKRCLTERVGFCVTKAALFAAAARAVGIPTKVGYADVRNHLVTGRLKALMDTDVFVFHGYNELYLAGRWVKATPIFNIELCRKFRVKPLEFDGRSDSMLHPFDEDARRHMEYVRDHGTFADVPHALILPAFAMAYAKMFKDGRVVKPGDFGAEAEAERGRQA
jgi:transglutaminase-like putative cysteine protease